MKRTKTSTLKSAAIGLIFGGMWGLQAQGQATEPWLGLVPVMEHTEGELAGMTTYRLYLYTLNADDFLVSCSGDDQNQMILASTATPAWFQHDLATTALATDVNPAFFPTFPEFMYDSWLTIGAEDNTAAVDVINLADPGYDAFDAFENGENVLVNTPVGNAWFVLPTAANEEAFAGDDLRVLVAQLTTAGEISGQIQIQLFYNFSNQTEFREVLPILTACNDANALNYDENSFSDDGCMYPEVDGVAEGWSLESLEVFPSPSSEWVTVRFPENRGWEGSQLVALGVDGRVAKVWRATGQTTRLDVSTLATGHYVLQVMNASNDALPFRGNVVVAR